MPEQAVNGAERASTASASQEQTPESRMAAFFGAQQAEQAQEAEQTEQATTAESEQASERAEEGEETPDEASDGLIDFEWNGKQYRVPPEFAELKGSVEMKSEYTRKTQDLADLRKQVTLQAETQRQAQEFKAVTAEDHDRLQAVQAQIKLFKGVDWASLTTEQYIRHKGELDTLKEQAAELQTNLDRKGKEFERAVGAKQAEMASNAYAYLAKHVRGWTPDSDIEKSIAKYVTDSGLPIDAFRNGTLAYPGLGVLAHKAMQFDKLQATKAGTLAQVKKVAAPVVKPGAQTGSNVAISKKYTEARTALRKDGSLESAARLFMLRGVK